MENDFVKKEKEILKFWEDIGLLEKLKEKNTLQHTQGRGKPWSFLDGPITANNPMGVHHAWGRTYKDLFQRFKSMQGFSERFQNGFDCQGLWVEVEVEKELGFKNKKDIEKYGIANFVNKCKERVHKYSKIQTQQSIRLGMLRDWGNWQTEFDEKGEWMQKAHSYYTMSPENNYAIWHFLKKCHEKGLLYKGHDVVAWCPRCGTAISQHEILTEEYKEITHKAIYFKLPVVGENDTYFLAWTTTPWTLPANVFLSVNPEFIYAKIADPKTGEIYILLKDKASLIENGQILETFKGKALEDKKYIGLFDELPAVKEALKNYQHKVILWKDVTAEEGTGVVHSAPGCGQEDFVLGKERELPVINPTNDESCYIDGFGELTGHFVGKELVRDFIFENLKAKNLVYEIEDYTHRYPTCWRCKSELIFRLVDEWYIAMTKSSNSKIKIQKSKKIEEDLRGELMKSVKKINWMPGFCLERELDWLKNMHDWLISKKRYWGLALPIYECSECKNFEVIGSKEELQKRAIEGWEEFEGNSPHRPWIDKIKIRCSKCNAVVSRIFDVGNPWLDAGIVPFSTISDDNRHENIPYFHNNKKEWDKWFPIDLVCESFPGQFKNWFYVLLVMSQVLENKTPFKNLLGFASVVDEKGEEMHKSKGNAIWFDEAVEKIGADVMRWMYVTQNPANNMRFGYNVAKETERKILTLTNCVKFFETYADKSKIKNQNSKIQIQNSKNILDKWIISKLNNLIKEATESLEKFDPMKVCLAIESFWINDLSLWYLRRSRKRFQSSENPEDREQGEQVFYEVLLTICKLIGPFMPFLAEDIYQQLKSKDMPESAHLCDWPKENKKFIDQSLEKEMQEVREVVSLALAKRAEVGIGVRQALASLKIRNPKFEIRNKEEFLALIKDEVNVKEIVFDEKIKDEIELDTEISEELKKEGLIREIIRNIQSLRKKAGLTPNDADIVINYFAGEKIVKVLKENQKQILESTRSKEIKEIKERQPVRNASPVNNASRSDAGWHSDAGGGEFLAQSEFKIDEESAWFGLGK
ncbi:MAG: isoleucine--tRNA ligase [Candidatus Pacebacteria bacterium]|nr:isoleucine--tRNA ligase [Candidatus Paceibacterota bacterium]